MNKSSIDEIRQRFDNDVERFSNLETGQSATMDAPLVLDLVTEAAAALTPAAKHVLDIGCGAGNYTLKLLQRLPNLDATLVDLSQPMLTRARQRVSAATPAGRVETLQGDIRDLPLPESAYDIVLAAAVLHHLRADAEWAAVFAKIHRALRPGGTFWVADFICHDDPRIQAIHWRQFGDYLTRLKGPDYRDHVFAYIEQEDTPRSLEFQLDLLRRTGFRQTVVLHKHACFAAFGAVK